MTASGQATGSLWEELRPGYVYLWRRMRDFRHEDEDGRSDTILLAFFLITFIPWLPIIWLAHLVRMIFRLLWR